MKRHQTYLNVSITWWRKDIHLIRLIKLKKTTKERINSRKRQMNGSSMTKDVYFSVRGYSRTSHLTHFEITEKLRLDLLILRMQLFFYILNSHNYPHCLVWVALCNLERPVSSSSLRKRSLPNALESIMLPCRIRHISSMAEEIVENIYRSMNSRLWEPKLKILWLIASIYTVSLQFLVIENLSRFL